MRRSNRWKLMGGETRGEIVEEEEEEDYQVELDGGKLGGTLLRRTKRWKLMGGKLGGKLLRRRRRSTGKIRMEMGWGFR